MQQGMVSGGVAHGCGGRAWCVPASKSIFLDSWARTLQWTVAVGVTGPGDRPLPWILAC